PGACTTGTRGRTTGHRSGGILGRLVPLGLAQTERNEAEVTTAVAPSALTAEGRGDRCGAQAYLRVELQSGGELLFCAHHAREHGDALKEIAVRFQDETHKLHGTPATASDDER